MKTFKLPDLGEGLPDAEIVEWHVKEGDTVEVDQLLVSMETAKAVVEVPSPYQGQISKLCGQPGDIIITGAPLVEFKDASGRQDTGTVAGNLEASEQVIHASPEIANTTQRSEAVKVTPAVRALAKRLGVDISQVTPTGPKGLMTAADIQASVGMQITAPTGKKATPGEPLRGVKRQMAIAMSKSHQSVVPVTVFDEADVTGWIQTDDITTRLIQAIVFAAQQEPSLNAWFEGEGLFRQIHTQVHLGLAMDTSEGLFVPVVKDAQEKNAVQLRQAIDQFKLSVSTRQVAPEQLQGATITLSNFGKFAGLYANPIVVPPQVAIIAVGRIHSAMRVGADKPAVHSIAPLSLTFDHRAVTGGEATRFLGAMMKHLGSIEPIS